MINTDLKDIDGEGYELETYRIAWLAELGWCDGNGFGLWETTKESHQFSTKSEAEEFLKNNPDIHETKWGLRPKYDYGICRVRREMQRTINES